jgi:hypothetical protein
MADMGFNRKPGPARPALQKEYEYPDPLLPPLPDEMKQRFPALADWEKTANDNYSRLLDVLLRRDREVSGAIEEVKEALP